MLIAVCAQRERKGVLERARLTGQALWPESCVSSVLPQIVLHALSACVFPLWGRMMLMESNAFGVHRTHVWCTDVGVLVTIMYSSRCLWQPRVQHLRRIEDAFCV